MEGNRFDGITRILAKNSRRRFLGALAAVALTTLLPRRAAAICSPAECDATFPCGFTFCDKITCRTSFSEAGTVCRPAAGPCDVAEVCSGSSLNCPADRHLNNGSSCPDDGNPCTDGLCENGQCVHHPRQDGAQCPDDGNPCTLDVCQSGVCAHLSKGNGATCGPGKVCQAGACQCASGADTCGDVCTDLSSDPSNCGACGRVCGNGHDCCRGTCAKLTSDKENCGRCGRRCRRGQRCRGGRCRKG